MSELTEERGKNYGHPADQFQCVEKMMDAWDEYRNIGNDIPDELEKCLRHTVYLILTKLSRACMNPLHMDNWADIKGYSECFEMCVERFSQLSMEPTKHASEPSALGTVTSEIKYTDPVITPFDDTMQKLKDVVEWMQEADGGLPLPTDEEEGVAT